MDHLAEWKSLIVARLRRATDFIEKNDHVSYEVLKDLDVAESDLHEVVVRFGSGEK